MSQGFLIAIAAYFLVVCSLYWWSHARRKRREREFNREAAFVRAALGTVDPREQARLAAVFQPGRDWWFQVRASFIVPALATVLYTAIRIDKITEPHASRYWFWVLVLWGLLDVLVARQLRCPRCGYGFRPVDGWKPKQCRKCDVPLTP